MRCSESICKHGRGKAMVQEEGKQVVFIVTLCLSETPQVSGKSHNLSKFDGD